MNLNAMKSGISFSPCRTWRYKLSRRWSKAGPMVAFIGLNPSTADEINDDPTVRRCIGVARRWGFGGMFMLNVFAFRSTNPRVLKTVADPIGPRNDAALLNTCRRCDMVAACWGMWGGLFDRHRAVSRCISCRVPGFNRRLARTCGTMDIVLPAPTLHPSQFAYRGGRQQVSRPAPAHTIGGFGVTGVTQAQLSGW